MNGVSCPGASVIIFESLSERVRSDANNGIDLWVKGLAATKGVDRDVVFLNVVNRSLEVLLANVGQKPDKIVGPPQYAGGQDLLNLRPLGLYFVDRRLQARVSLGTALSTDHPGYLDGSIAEITYHDTELNPRQSR